MIILCIKINSFKITEIKEVVVGLKKENKNFDYDNYIYHKNNFTKKKNSKFSFKYF